MPRASKRSKSTAASSRRQPQPACHADLVRFERPTEADPVELASALAICQFLCVIGRLPEHTDFLERALAASARLLIWPDYLRPAIPRVIPYVQARGSDTFLVQDPDAKINDNQK